MKTSLAAIRTAFGAALVLWACGAATVARAENHALIMWIGQYADPRANLPGIDLDAKRARQIALAMGVAEANITEVKNEQLTWQGMANAIAGLTGRIGQGDKVFLYYSGHGAQRTNAVAGKKCSEGLVAQDIQLYFDRDLEADLGRLGAKASQVVMMNDSCFSGGASEKGLPKGGRKLVPKAYPGEVAGGGAASGAQGADYQCGDAVNKGVLTKSFEVVERSGANMLYVAAAADNEVSYATTEGSLATQAWAACITDPAADKDHSGNISGEELRVCAQARIDGSGMSVRQHVTLTGTATLPISFVSKDVPAAPVALNAANALRDISAGSDKSYVVKLVPARNSLRIGQDFLDFSVETNREGYLYILQVGSDGKTFNLLFPNKVDANNRVPAGKQRFPRPSWALRSTGPAGTNYLMALVSATPKDFSGQMKQGGTFASTPSTRVGYKSLVVVATGAAAGGNGRYGTSEVVPLVEAP